MPQTKYTFWQLFQKEIVYLFLLIILTTFVLNFNEYAYIHNFKSYNEAVWSLFSIKNAWWFKIWAWLFTLLLMPISLISFVFLNISVIKPAFFKKTFMVKSWYSIFILQILTWVLIVSY